MPANDCKVVRWNLRISKEPLPRLLILMLRLDPVYTELPVIWRIINLLSKCLPKIGSPGAKFRALLSAVTQWTRMVAKKPPLTRCYLNGEPVSAHQRHWRECTFVSDLLHYVLSHIISFPWLKASLSSSNNGSSWSRLLWILGISGMRRECVAKITP